MRGTVTNRVLHLGAPGSVCARTRRCAAREGVQCRLRVRNRRCRKALPDGAARALELGLVRVDLQECASRVERRRPAELQREVEALADQQHAIRLRKHLGKGAETRVCHPARAFHAHDWNARGILQCGGEHAPAPREPRRPDEDDGARRIAQASHQRIASPERRVEPAMRRDRRSSARMSRSHRLRAYPPGDSRARVPGDLIARRGLLSQRRRQARRRCRRSMPLWSLAQRGRPGAFPGTLPSRARESARARKGRAQVTRPAAQ